MTLSNDKLDAISSKLDRLIRIWESMSPIGFFSQVINVTDQLKEISFRSPLISLMIDNDGLGDVYFEINEMRGDITRGVPIEDGDGFGVFSMLPAIDKLYLKAAAGTTATVWIWAEEGRKWY